MGDHDLLGYGRKVIIGRLSKVLSDLPSPIDANDEFASNISTTLTKAYQTAAILFEVLKDVNLTEFVDVDAEVADKTDMCAPYNILSLDPNSKNQAIMRYPELCYSYMWLDEHVIWQWVKMGLKRVNFDCEYGEIAWVEMGQFLRWKDYTMIATATVVSYLDMNARIMSAEVDLIKTDVEKERSISSQMAIKCKKELLGKMETSSTCSVEEKPVEKLTMLPNPRDVKAFRAMREIGIPEEKTKQVLKNLLKLYEKNWELTEVENYRALTGAIFDSEESEAAEQKKKLEQADLMKAIEEETQILEEPERPLKRPRLRHQDGFSCTPNSIGTPLKKKKLEEIEALLYAVPKSQSKALAECTLKSRNPKNCPSIRKPKDGPDTDDTTQSEVPLSVTGQRNVVCRGALAQRDFVHRLAEEKKAILKRRNTLAVKLSNVANM
ncbi:pre-SET zinc-binding sub-group [Artemisia annua]|uniref:Pre-SET zinc-binding sub-group n=1 Tax=Artemisia annua TaxID=35608 RepID=A0A2U1LCE0_ARTAN|nr:pre-SET zinc-binding sub-group [Artemisia annua]